MNRFLLISVRAYGNAMAGRLAGWQEQLLSISPSPRSMSLPLAQISFFSFLSSLAAAFSVQLGISESSLLQTGSAVLHLPVAILVSSLHQVNLGYCPGVLLCILYPKHRQMCQLQPPGRFSYCVVSFTASLHLKCPTPPGGLVFRATEQSHCF